jgi:hypothetical protein
VHDSDAHLQVNESPRPMILRAWLVRRIGNFAIAAQHYRLQHPACLALYLV